jgi:peptidoglycan/xylan/chitin deacetylase (PgdA/CDA1 family)
MDYQRILKHDLQQILNFCYTVSKLVIYIFKLIIRYLRIIMCAALLFLFLLMKSSEVIKGVPVLIYHAVDNHQFGSRELIVNSQEFYKQMEYLHVQKYTTLTFNNIRAYCKYKNPILITFDDGYRDIYFYAFPVLKEFKLQATIFLIAGLIDHPGYLTQKEIGEMSEVFSFESHTLTHPKLDTMSVSEIEKECGKSKDIIESLTSRPVNALSFPFGRDDRNVLAVAKKYYKYCVTTRYGNYSNGDNPYEINRIYINHSDTMDTFRKKIQKGRTR